MALTIQEEVAWLQIAMQQVGGVHVFQTLEHLVNDILLVDVFQNIGPDNSMQIGIHEVEY